MIRAAVIVGEINAKFLDCARQCGSGCRSAPERYRQTDDGCQTEGSISFRCDTRKLLARDVDGTAGYESGHLIEMLRDGAGICKQSIDRNERRQRGKDRKQSVVRHAGGEGENPMVPDVGINAE